MIEKKMNNKVLVIMIFLALVIILGVIAIYNLLFTGIEDSEGNLLANDQVIGLTALISLVLLTYLLTIITFLNQMIFKKKLAYRIDQNGIYNTYIGVYFLAFVIVVPVDYIPWEAVELIDDDNEVLIAKIDGNKVKTSFMGKILFSCLKYKFCPLTTKERLTEEEVLIIKNYCN